MYLYCEAMAFLVIHDYQGISISIYVRWLGAVFMFGIKLLARFPELPNRRAFQYTKTILLADLFIASLQW